MKVFVNAAPLRIGGGYTLLAQTIRYLAGDTDHSYTFCVLPATAERLAPLAAGSAVKLVTYPHASTAGAARFFHDQVTVPRMLRRGRYDVLYSMSGLATLRSPIPQLLLAQNALSFSAPAEHLRRVDRVAVLRRWWSGASVRAADVLATPTAVMAELVNRTPALNQRSKHILILPYGHEHTFARSAGNNRTLQEMARLRQDGWHLLLFVSIFAPHKDVPTALRALRQLRDAGHRVKLVATIPDAAAPEYPFGEEIERVHALIAELGLEEDVVRTGVLPLTDVCALYEAADTFVFPSVAESFGLPMLEALAAGLPIVAADTPVNREVCGAAARYFAAGDAVGCAAALARVVTQPQVRAVLSQASLARARAFTWRRHVDELRSALHRAACGRPPASALPLVSVERRSTRLAPAVADQLV